MILLSLLFAVIRVAKTEDLRKIMRQKENAWNPDTTILCLDLEWDILNLAEFKCDHLSGHVIVIIFSLYFPAS